MIHTSLGKSKKRKPTAKQRELDSQWEKLMKKYEPKKPIAKKVDSWTPPKPYTRETPKIASLPFTAGPCAKAPEKRYTGSAIKGIGTMHKSNAVPIFSDEQAIEIATMRRG